MRLVETDEVEDAVTIERSARHERTCSRTADLRPRRRRPGPRALAPADLRARGRAAGRRPAPAAPSRSSSTSPPRAQSSSFELAAKRTGRDTWRQSRRGVVGGQGRVAQPTPSAPSAPTGPTSIVIRHPQVGAPPTRPGTPAPRWSTPATARISIRPRACSTCTSSARPSAASRGCAWPSSATSCTPAWPAPTSPRCVLCGAEVRLIGPPSLMPRGIEAAGVTVSHDIGELAVGRRRLRPAPAARAHAAGRGVRARRSREYAARWGVDEHRVRPGQVVMHPGPMNRGVEITGAVADSPASLIERQVRAGLLVRMAVLSDLLAPARTAHADLAGGGRMSRGAGLRSAARRRPRTSWYASARVLDPADGLDAPARRARPRRHRSPPSARTSSRRRARRSSRPRPHAPAGLPRPARAPAHAGRGGRGGPGLRHRRGGGRRLRGHPGDAEHRPGARLGRRSCAPCTTGQRRRRWSPSASSARSAAASRVSALAELGALADAGAVGFSDDGRPVERSDVSAPRAPVRRRDRPCALAALRGPRAQRRRLRARGRRLGGARAAAATRPVASPRWSARDLRLARYERQPLHLLPPARRRVGGRGALRPVAGARRLGGGLAAPPAADRRGVRALDPDRKMNPPLAAPADRDALVAALRDGTRRLRGHRPRPAHPVGQGRPLRGGAQRASSGSRSPSPRSWRGSSCRGRILASRPW